ncbi:membrane protein [Roseibium aquae]|uniref:Membrane protein n=1 Tax=Roseibium aquae TaxID=1323746 RepID=A0A916TAQ3_9HYPH|nr:LysE family translocator [Roseibium aquae]GGB36404.1 membrane protein [Roseibium aquae]
MTTFAAAVFFLLITPGPGVLSTAGVASGFGRAAALRYVAGLFLGTNLVALAVVSGLAAAVFSVPYLREVLFAASAVYLLYLALKIALSGTRVAFIHPERPPGVGGGLTLQMINPKAYAVNTAFFSGFPFFPDSFWIETLVKFAIVNAIWIPVHLLWLSAGILIRRLNLPERVHKAINIAMAVSMLLVVALAVLAQF